MKTFNISTDIIMILIGIINLIIGFTSTSQCSSVNIIIGTYVFVQGILYLISDLYEKPIDK